MNEQERRAFCKNMGMPYTAPEPQRRPPLATSFPQCVRAGCDNNVGDRANRFTGNYEGFCSAICRKYQKTPKVKK